MAQSIPKPKWYPTEYRNHGTLARVHCMTCDWRSEWERNMGLHIAQVKADHRFTVHDPKPRQRMVGIESKRQFKRARG